MIFFCIENANEEGKKSFKKTKTIKSLQTMNHERMKETGGIHSRRGELLEYDWAFLGFLPFFRFDKKEKKTKI